MSEAHFDRLYNKMLAFWQGHDVYVQDCAVGADPAYSLPAPRHQPAGLAQPLRAPVVHPARPAQTAGHRPEFTIMFAPDFQASPAEDGTNSETAIVINFKKRVVLICGTSYAGEMKKSAFTILNYLLPGDGVFPMHCSANVGPGRRRGAVLRTLRHRQDHALGRSRPPADRRRRARLERRRHLQFRRRLLCQVHPALAAERAADLERHPLRHGARERGDGFAKPALLDFDSDEVTENTRAAYPLDFIDNAVIPSVGGHPVNVIFLTADAFGVLPPISRLTPEQAMYHFLAGTRPRWRAPSAAWARSRRPPSAPASARPFCPRPAATYASLLGEKLRRHRAACWLVNTGWVGGPFGVGSRMKLPYTRAMLNAALAGELNGVPSEAHPVFQCGGAEVVSRRSGAVPGCPRHVGG